MAIQSRRGSYSKFDPDKLLAGEKAVVLDGDPSTSDGESTYECFSPGNVKRTVTSDELEALKTSTDEKFNTFYPEKLNTARTIDGVLFDGSADIHHYMPCTSAADTTPKIVYGITLSSTTDTSLKNGTRIYVQFQNGSTAGSFELRAYPHLAYPVYYHGSTTIPEIPAGAVLALIIIDSAWHIVGL